MKISHEICIQEELDEESSRHVPNQPRDEPNPYAKVVGLLVGVEEAVLELRLYTGDVPRR